MESSRIVLNRHDVAKAVGKDPVTVSNWHKAGKMPPPVTSPRGRILGWLEEDIGPWLLSRARSAK